MIIRHTDGLGHVNLANMDMDAFKEFMWPGVVAKNYMVEVFDYDRNGSWDQQYAFGTKHKYSPHVELGTTEMWCRAWLQASCLKHAKRKARAMVRDHLTKSHGTCAMTTGEYDAKE